MVKAALITAAAALSLAAATSASATQIYSTTNGLSGNQQWTGSLGLNFTVNQKVVVDSLGVFDSLSDGLNANLFVTIYDSNGNQLVTPVEFTAGTANPGGTAYLFQSITPLVLGPGSYQLTAWGYGSGEANFNNSAPGGPITFDTFGGRLTADGTSYSGSAGVFATIPDDGLTRYGAGSMTVAVPEPASWLMMIGGFGLIGGAMRRRRVSVRFA